MESSPAVNFQWLFESAPGLYLILLPDLTIVAVSNAYLDATMTRRTHIIGRKLFDIFPDNPDDPVATGVTNLRSSLNNVLQNKTSHTMAVQKYDIRRPDGSFEERYWSPLNKPVLNDEGEVIYIIHRVEDVTEFIHLKSEDARRSKQIEEMEAEIYKRAQEIQSNNKKLQNEIIERKNAEEKFKSLIESAPDAMVIVNERGEIVIINKQTENLFGYNRDELINKPVELLVPSAYQHKHKQHRANYFSEPKVRTMGAGVALYAAHKNGSLFPVEISLSPLETSEGMLTSAAIRDITERKKTEERLKESEENYSILFNSIDEGFCIIEMIFDDQKKPVDYRFLEVNASFERQTGLHDAVGKRMREFAPDHEEHWFETYGRIAQTGESTRFENRAEQLGRWYDVYAFRFGEPDKSQVAILFNDITKPKETEEQLQKVNKELEAFSYSVSHDLRAPLRIIDGYTDIIVSDYAAKLDEEGNRLLGIVTSNVRKMGQLIDDLLNLSRLGRKELMIQHIDMNKMAASVFVEQLQVNGAQYDVKINELLPVRGDINLVRQVWINIISNALKYSAVKKEPIIELNSFDNGTEIIYSIKDNGVGFNMQYADKLFGVFQRLHKMTEFEGTGVGLALVQRIIARHGGRVWAEGEVDKGATFFFSMPVEKSGQLAYSTTNQNKLLI